MFITDLWGDVHDIKFGAYPVISATDNHAVAKYTQKGGFGFKLLGNLKFMSGDA